MSIARRTFPSRLELKRRAGASAPKDLVLKDHNTTIAAWVHNEGVGTVQNDPVAVPPIERHERIAALGPSRPSREVIAELTSAIVSK